MRRAGMKQLLSRLHIRSRSTRYSPVRMVLFGHGLAPVITNQFKLAGWLNRRVRAELDC